MGSQLRHGVTLSYILILLNNIVYLFFTPFLLTSLGQGNYGLYILMGSIIGYIALLDLGLTNGVIRFIVKEREKKVGDENRIISLFFYLYLVISVFIIAVGWLIYQNLELIFINSLTFDEIDLAKKIFILLIINLAISLPFNTFSSAIISSERFIFNKSLGILRIIVRVSLLVIFLNLGYGVLTLVLIDTFVNLLIGVLNVVYSFKFLKVKIIKTPIKLSFLKEVFSYSFLIFLIMIADIINQKFGHVILGIKMNTNSVAIFGVAFAIIGMFTQLSSALTNVFVPRITKLAIKNEDTKVFNEFVKVSRIQLIILGLVMGGYILYGQAFVNLWAGTEYNEVWIVSLIILIPLSLDLLQNLGVQILYAKNKHKFRAYTMLLSSVLSVFLSLILIDRYGILGAAFGTAFSYLVGNVILTNFYYHFRMNINVLEYFWRTLKGLWLPIVSTYIFMYYLSIEINQSWIILLVSIILYTLIYAVSTFILGINAYEKKVIMNIFVKLLSKLGKNTSQGKV